MDDTESRCNKNDRKVSYSQDNADLSSSCARAEDDEIYLGDYLRVLLKYRWMIFLICIFAVVATAIVSLVQPKIYSATASVVPPIEMLQRESGLAGGLGLGNSSLISKALGTGGIAELYVGILQSRAVADAIIDRFDLMKAYGPLKYRMVARNMLGANTTVRVSDEGIVTITVEDTDPDRAAAIANAYVDELDRRNKRLYAGQATSKRVFLANRLKAAPGRISSQTACNAIR